MVDVYKPNATQHKHSSYNLHADLGVRLIADLISDAVQLECAYNHRVFLSRAFCTTLLHSNEQRAKLPVVLLTFDTSQLKAHDASCNISDQNQLIGLLHTEVTIVTIVTVVLCELFVTYW